MAVFFLVTQRSRDLLEKRFVASVTIDLVANPSGLSPQTKLPCCVEHVLYSFFRQILQRRLTAPWSGQRNICAERIRQNRGIYANLRHIAIRSCAREKFAVALLDENVQHRLFKRRIRRVAVRFPVAIDEINFDTAAHRFTTVYSNRSIAKIRSS